MKVRFTRPALADLEATLEYLQTRSPQGAGRVRRRIDILVELLSTRPFLGTLTADPTIRRLTTRPYPYLVFYEVTGEEIIIHAVRHGARDPASMPGGSKPRPG